MSTIYVIGSLRNQRIPDVGNALRQAGYDVYDSWFAGGERADDEWQRYSQRRGQSYIDALNDWAAIQVFEYDLRHLKRSDAAVLIYPAGKSAHTEMGWVVGQGKPVHVLVEEEPPRWDVMLRFATGVHSSLDDLILALKRTLP